VGLGPARPKPHRLKPVLLVYSIANPAVSYPTHKKVEREFRPALPILPV
jgi:hypothetical protein